MQRSCEANRVTDRTAELARKAAQRAAAEHAGKPLDEMLAAIAGNDLTTLLLHAHRVRARERSFRDLRDASERQLMTRASTADARRLHAFDAALFEIAAHHEAVALAPVSPLGTAACAGIEPNHALATLRLGEVAADPTGGLALEAMHRRKAGARGPLHLVASQRVLRMQPLGGVPGFTPHFQLAAIASYQRSARAADNDAVDRALLVAHVGTWANLFTDLPARGFRVDREAAFRVVFADVRLTRAALRARGGDPDALSRQAAAHKPTSTADALTAAGIDLPRALPAADLAATVATLGLPRSMQSLAAALVDELATPLAASHPHVTVAFDLARIQGLSYYAGPCLQLHVRHDDGREFNLGDGGSLAWLGALLDDRRERMVTTGVGAELLAKLF